MRKLTLLFALSLLLVGCGTSNNEGTENTPASEVQNETATQNEVETEVVEDTTVPEETTEVETPESTYTYTDLDKTLYAKSSVNVRDLPNTDGAKLGALSWAQEVHVTGQCNETSWYRIEYDGGIAYVSNNYLVDTKPVASANGNGNGDSGSGSGNGGGNTTTTDPSIGDDLPDNYIHPYMQTAINAGYWNLVCVDASTNSYAMLTDGREYMDDGTFVPIYFRNLLKSHGIYSYDISRCWIDASKNYYYHLAENCFPYEGE